MNGKFITLITIILITSTIQPFCVTKATKLQCVMVKQQLYIYSTLVGFLYRMAKERV